MRSRGSLVVSCALLLSGSVARAQGELLLAADNPQQISQVDLAQVMASDSTRWLSVRLTGQTRLAVVSSAELETASSGDAWLRAVDFATRERIAAPPGPLAVCPERASFPLADSGWPEIATLATQSAITVGSELELQRTLANAGIALNLAQIDEFSAHDAPPYQVLWFAAPSAGGATAAVRWAERSSNELPKIRVPGVGSVPINLIALAKDAVLPSTGGAADPSEFAIRYFALSATSDYVAARSAWHKDYPDRWLAEAVSTPALFDDTVRVADAASPAAVPRYFSALTDNVERATSCLTQVGLARARRSSNGADFSCAGGDDLTRTEDELDFADVRLTRLFGSTTAPSEFIVGPATPQSPRLQATDFDTKGCSLLTAPEPGATAMPAAPVSGGRGAGAGVGTFGTGEVDTGEIDTSAAQTTVASDQGGCNLGLDTNEDSCNGDPSPSSAASDGNDSCSGDSSSGDASDSCSGDSASSSNDASGCGSNDKSGYDGDTCSGNSANSTRQGLESPRQARPRRLHLSLVMLLAAGLSLPLRRSLK